MLSSCYPNCYCPVLYYNPLPNDQHPENYNLLPVTNTSSNNLLPNPNTSSFNLLPVANACRYNLYLLLTDAFRTILLPYETKTYV